MGHECVPSEKNVQTGNLDTPFYLVTLLEPLAMLTNHTVNDVDERFVAIEQPVTPGENVSFEPPFNSVLRKDFHNTTLVG